jgi:integrase
VRRLLGSCTVGEVTTAKLRWYVARRLDEGRANATINRELAALRRAFNLARGDNLVRQLPMFPMLPEQNTRRVFFELEEVNRVVRFLPDYLQDGRSSPITRHGCLDGPGVNGTGGDAVGADTHSFTHTKPKPDSGQGARQLP